MSVVTPESPPAVGPAAATAPPAAAPPAASEIPDGGTVQAAVPPSPVSCRTRWVVLGLLAVIVGGHLVEVVTQREHWPFSPYQMWSKPSLGWDVTREMLRGVTDEPMPHEIALAPGHLDPIPYQMVVVNLQRANNALKKGDRELADRLIGGLLAHYNRRVEAGKIPGPKLKEFRLYQVTWRMDTDASVASRQSPTQTELLLPTLTDAQRAAAVPPVATKITSEFGDDNSSSD